MSVPNWIWFVAGAALCWGSYVPTIHMAQKAMAMAAIKAFFFVGLAYFLVAVLVPGVAIWGIGTEEAKPFTTKGAWLGILAGILGAGGALCVIFAIKSGGAPLYVAPLVFMGAPVVNVLISTYLHPPADGWSSVNPLFYVGLLLAPVAGGLVLYYKPS